MSIDLGESGSILGDAADWLFDTSQQAAQVVRQDVNNAVDTVSNLAHEASPITQGQRVGEQLAPAVQRARDAANQLMGNLGGALNNAANTARWTVWLYMGLLAAIVLGALALVAFVAVKLIGSPKALGTITKAIAP